MDERRTRPWLIEQMPCPLPTANPHRLHAPLGQRDSQNRRGNRRRIVVQSSINVPAVEAGELHIVLVSDGCGV